MVSRTQNHLMPLPRLHKMLFRLEIELKLIKKLEMWSCRWLGCCWFLWRCCWLGGRSQTEGWRPLDRAAQHKQPPGDVVHMIAATIRVNVNMTPTFTQCSPLVFLASCLIAWSQIVQTKRILFQWIPVKVTSYRFTNISSNSFSPFILRNCDLVSIL